MKTIALSSIALLALAIAPHSTQASTDLDPGSLAPPAVPLGNNWGCDSKEGIDKANACRDSCKDTYNAKRNACRDDYKTCSQQCSGKERWQCRADCRATYKSCLEPLRSELDRCSRSCVTNTEGCRYF